MCKFPGLNTETLWLKKFVCLLIFRGLNMFLVAIKLRPCKFSPYLILIAFLILTKKNYL